MTAATPPERPWWLYLLECRGGSLYAGISPDPQQRYRLHASGRGARYTRANPPLRLLAACAYPSRSAASVAEHWLKQQARAAKLAWAADHPYPDGAETRAAHSAAVISRSSSASRRVPRPA
ncbi:GIY-YIG nuclease family protein [Stagnimonas aquatica]|uniref:GIY-YIG nuclease family protein n=1 Tax=Stagnimonas aquatica TaxID=2689987 RepID=A0A3N0VL94_9GAMM|nr:GIY-YIG nuclease family protein [Stagnimonas aquatica]ROH93533.1 GIY-YIG nuclease family protein [Stagnimonas aquatica]